MLPLKPLLGPHSVHGWDAGCSLGADAFHGHWMVLARLHVSGCATKLLRMSFNALAGVGQFDDLDIHLAVG